MIRLFAFVLFAVASSVSAAPTPLVLIALDGFRWDYCALHPAETVHLRRLAREGVTAQALIPVFPSNTFPNLHTIVTGLYPSHHGMINNHFFDPARKEYFHYNRPALAQDGSWWGGEPVWATAGKQGYRSACGLWVGSDAEIAGRRPTYWRAYSYTTPFEKRVDELAGWLKEPVGERPIIVTFYLEETNSVGHNDGPDSPALAAAVKLLDDRIGAILQRFSDEAIEANVVIVSDHGMTSCGPDRVAVFEDFIDLATVQVDFQDTVAGLRPLPGTDAAETLRALGRMPHMRVYRAADLPGRLHIDAGNPRVPPIWILPDDGWHVARRSSYLAALKNFRKGQHGYDPMFPSMHGIFIASGPAFKSGVVIEPLENVHVYNLLCAVLDLKPAPNDGDDRLVLAALRK